MRSDAPDVRIHAHTCGSESDEQTEAHERRSGVRRSEVSPKPSTHTRPDRIRSGALETTAWALVGSVPVPAGATRRPAAAATAKARQVAATATTAAGA